MRRPRTRQLLAVGAAALLTVATGCSGDDETAATTTTAATGTTAITGSSSSGTATAAGAASARAACDTWIAADDAVNRFMASHEGDVTSVNAALDRALASADPAVKDTMSSLIDAVQPQLSDPESDSSEETDQLYAHMVDWAGDTCAVKRIAVTAAEYRYEGIPSELPRGYTVVDFTNHGTENHELIVFRRNDGVTQPIEDLLQLPEDELMSKVTIVSFGFAPSGKTTTAAWNLDEPGDYVALCFLPVGSVGDTQGQGPPHFTQGMTREFTVV